MPRLGANVGPTFYRLYLLTSDFHTLSARARVASTLWRYQLRTLTALPAIQFNICLLYAQYEHHVSVRMKRKRRRRMQFDG
jgi:hypothetical protein